MDYVKSFQNERRPLRPDTLILNSKIYHGPRYGHFFFISESNLVQLYQGKLAVTVGLARRRWRDTSMVMIYPKEGATAHNHSGNILAAPWVTAEQAEAAAQWLAYLREDPQQQAFMAEGFRPGTKLPLGDTISPKYGLDPTQPRVTLDPDSINPATAYAISGAWGDVKKPGIAVFVADTTGSMSGKPIAAAKDGLTRAIDGMNPRNSVGLLSFADGIKARVEVAPLLENKFALGRAVEGMVATGGTALYDAVKAGIEMADSAPGPEDAIRGVIVVTDGQANTGGGLDRVVRMMSSQEAPISRYAGL